MQRTHTKTPFLLQSISIVPASCLASRYIYQYALSPERLASTATNNFSLTKEVLA